MGMLAVLACGCEAFYREGQAPFVYRLGRQPFTLQRRVRFPQGAPFYQAGFEPTLGGILAMVFGDAYATCMVTASATRSLREFLVDRA